MEYRFLLLCIVLANTFSLAVSQTQDILNFNSLKEKKRFENLVLELRCPKCENQSIADSNADISKDMRSELNRLVVLGASDSEIKKFMVKRFGIQVLYRPPLTWSTSLLWFGPLIMVIIGLFLVALLIRKNYLKSD